MAKEIERKFLTLNDQWKSLISESYFLSQGYLKNDPDCCVRVRLTDTEGFLTIKGKNEGISRDEFEYSIPREEAQTLLNQFCQSGIITKIRHHWYAPDGHLWEIDEFQDSLAPLVLAEIELSSENESFIKPTWLGQDVSLDPDYYNVNLLKKAIL